MRSTSPQPKASSRMGRGSLHPPQRKVSLGVRWEESLPRTWLSTQYSHLACVCLMPPRAANVPTAGVFSRRVWICCPCPWHQQDPKQPSLAGIHHPASPTLSTHRSTPGAVPSHLSPRSLT